MKTKKIPFIFLTLLMFLLIVTSCTTSKRPIPENNNVNKNTNMTQPRASNDAEANNKKTKDNIMPNVPKPVTPNSTAGFTLDQINEFDLDIELTNNDKINMKYIKGPSNKNSKVETKLNGKVAKTEHEEASREIEKLLKEIPGASLSNVTTIIDGTLAALKIKRDNVIDFDMDFKFESGEKVQIKLNKK